MLYNCKNQVQDKWRLEINKKEDFQVDSIEITANSKLIVVIIIIRLSNSMQLYFLSRIKQILIHNLLYRQDQYKIIKQPL
jgi:hypothetical protein